jgi:hypothetical protein
MPLRYTSVWVYEHSLNVTDGYAKAVRVYGMVGKCFFLDGIVNV